jgi:thymidine phosphorylase
MEDANEETPSSRELRAIARNAGTVVQAESNFAPVDEDISAIHSGIVQEIDHLQALAPVSAMGGTNTSEVGTSKEDEIVKRLDVMMTIFANLQERVIENEKAVSQLSPLRSTNPSLILGT